MTKVFIKYNPYTVESEIAIDGRAVEAPNRLADLRNERIQTWIEELIPILDELCNDDEYEIDFYGTRLDYDDVDAVMSDYMEAHPDVRISINFTEAKGSDKDRIASLVSLFESMQKDCPFASLKDPQIRENFKNAISSDFEVSVIATMSSGKSTLINALLGRELMPSKNEACTATIAKIKDIDGKENFSAEYLDDEGNLLGRFDDLTLADMTSMNENPATAYINIEGDIPNIDSSGMRLVLVDTPGPNNSRTDEHEAHTYRVIKEKSKPMVLYVMNATQLQTDDDEELLTEVSKAMKVGGKQSKDRFIFVVNKADTYDTEKESIKCALDHVREYLLKKADIENPNLFPASAEMAKVIRMYQNGQSLTKKQKSTLKDYDFFIDDEQLHLSEQANLSRDNMRIIEDELAAAREAGDGYQEALIHTGIPAVELAIDEYLRKYAYTAKIKTAVDTFRKKVEDEDIHAKLFESIQNDEASRIALNTRLQAVRAQLEEGKSGKEFRRKIQNLDMMEEANERIDLLRAKVNQVGRNTSGKSEMTEYEVTHMMSNLERTITALQSDVKTELESIIDDVINKGAQDIIKDYRKQIHLLLQEGELAAGKYSGGGSISFLEESLPDAQNLIDQYKFTRKVDTGETETVKNYKHKWWDFLELFEPRKVTRKIFQDVQMVDSLKVYMEYIDPVIASFNRNLENARKSALEEAERFKAFFLKELDALDDALKKKVQEDEELTRDQASVEKKIAEDREKVKWLDDFLGKLDEILEI